MTKLNCWEYMMCGRESCGKNVNKLGVCPAAIETRTDGINGGCNGGRACWAIAGTLCKGKVQGTFAMKYSDCRKCEFYEAVRKEEGRKWENVKAIREKLEHAA